LTAVTTGHYGHYVIPYDPKTEVCPYRTPEMRAKWHQERKIADPEFSSVTTRQRTKPEVVEVPDPPEVKAPQAAREVERAQIELDDEEAPPLQGMTRQERYRAANKEKLAAKARERRAKK
jgi:hypothetical protein